MLKKMLNPPLFKKKNNKHSLSKRLITFSIASTTFLSQSLFPQPTNAYNQSYCQLNSEETSIKEKLLEASLEGNTNAKQQYKNLVRKHSVSLQQCRSVTWPQEQAIWLRLYPCDISAGSLDRVLDRIVNKGYNKVYLEVFFDSQVLLPPAENKTPWISVARSPGAEQTDLLAQAIKKGHERGLKVYAWLFTMNFGYTYAQRGDRQVALARNGKGEDSINFVDDRSQAFVDPYNQQAQTDYYRLVQAILQRNPDGMLFDYIRYPRGSGSQSVVHGVKDLWIYGDASLQTLYNRAGNNKGLALLEKFIKQGDISFQDVTYIDKMHAKESEPLWQGRQVANKAVKESPGDRYNKIRQDLWYLSVAHAAQGILDFLSFAAKPANERGLPTGAVFFPDANRLVGRSGFDSRLQAWDRFPSSMEWHPMSYSTCGQDTSCIVNEVRQVVKTAPQGTKITPALAGVWGQNFSGHLPLENQMQAIRASFPEINSVSHFSFSWQELDLDRQRKFCNIQ
jgi:hypothetical protein